MHFKWLLPGRQKNVFCTDYNLKTISLREKTKNKKHPLAIWTGLLVISSDTTRVFFNKKQIECLNQDPESTVYVRKLNRQFSIFEHYTCIKVSGRDLFCELWPKRKPRNVSSANILTLSPRNLKVWFWTTFTSSIILAFRKQRVELIKNICKPMGMG